MMYERGVSRRGCGRELEIQLLFSTHICGKASFGECESKCESSDLHTGIGAITIR